MKSIEQLESEARQFMTQNDFQNCINVLNEALKITQSSKPLDLITVARLLNNLGFAYSQLRNLQTAEKYFRQSLEVERQIGDPYNPEMAITLQHLGRMAHLRRDYETSWKLWTEALEIWKRLVLGKNQGGYIHYLASCLHALGEHMADTGNYSLARTNFEQALDLREKVLPTNHPDIAENLANLGKLCAFTKDPSSARNYLKRAIPLYISELGENHLEVRNLIGTLAKVEKQLASH
jgi:tetratricopeptide (TPR) repeat protein